jgi:hypothetical protein
MKTSCTDRDKKKHFDAIALQGNYPQQQGQLICICMEEIRFSEGEDQIDLYFFLLHQIQMS